MTPDDPNKNALIDVLSRLRQRRDELGRTEEARRLAIAITDLEKLMVWLGYPID